MTHPSRRPTGNYVEFCLVSTLDGVWCHDCLLPSIMEMRFAITMRLDPTRWIGERILHACDECGVSTWETHLR